MLFKRMETKMNGNHQMRVKKAEEAGSIMLEVIAVLSVMALMGAMLFRQIYLRNQELTNVQLASEVRMMKEALAAWIQANPKELAGCNPNPTSGDPVMCLQKTASTESPLLDGSDFSEGVERYLPESYKNLTDVYNLYVQCEYIGTNLEIKKCFGMVIPLELPDDWSFRRAARVATLIGADGGAWGLGSAVPPLGNQYTFYGNMGAWEITLNAGGEIKDSLGDKVDALVMATTGIDVFQPEVDMPMGEVNLEEHWVLGLKELGVYGQFVAGTGSACYRINHDNRGAGNKIEQDVINVNTALHSTDCLPAFLVEEDLDGNNGTGNVRVRNELSVGYDYNSGLSAMRFDKDGMIVFENEHRFLTDPDLGITDYLLDPAYTSVMNDIKLESRGGARLSDILPNYILKNVVPFTKSGDTEIAEGFCPKKYNLAVVIQPTHWPELKVDKKNLVVKTTRTVVNNVPVGGADGKWEEEGGVEGADKVYKSKEPVGKEKLLKEVTVELSLHEKPFDPTALTSDEKNVGEVVTEIKPRERGIYLGSASACSGFSNSYYEIPKSGTKSNYDPTKKYHYFYSLVEKDEAGNLECLDDASGIAYFYCVFDTATTVFGSKRSVSTDCPKFKKKGTCQMMDGCIWNNAGSDEGNFCIATP